MTRLDPDGVSVAIANLHFPVSPILIRNAVAAVDAVGAKLIAPPRDIVDRDDVSDHAVAAK